MWVIYMQSITTAPQYGESNKPEESWLLEAEDPDPELEPGTPSQARIRPHSECTAQVASLDYNLVSYRTPATAAAAINIISIEKLPI